MAKTFIFHGFGGSWQIFDRILGTGSLYLHVTSTSTSCDPCWIPHAGPWKYTHTRKINMEPNNGGLLQMIFSCKFGWFLDSKWKFFRSVPLLLLMAEILHHLGCKKHLVNDGINYQPQLVFSPDFWTINSTMALLISTGSPCLSFRWSKSYATLARLWQGRPSNSAPWRMDADVEISNSGDEFLSEFFHILFDVFLMGFIQKWWIQENVWCSPGKILLVHKEIG